MGEDAIESFTKQMTFNTQLLKNIWKNKKLSRPSRQGDGKFGTQKGEEKDHSGTLKRMSKEPKEQRPQSTQATMDVHGEESEIRLGSEHAI